MLGCVYDLVNIGGGVSGTALAYVTNSFTNIRSSALLEHYSAVAQVNSNRINNAQTLHKGDIETNFSLQKALEIKVSSDFLAQFLERYGEPGVTFARLHKMALGVGRSEVEFLRNRFLEFKPHFPDLELFWREEIALVEPKVIEGRDPNVDIAALFSPNGHAVDYQKVSEIFLAQARRNAEVSGKVFDVRFNTKVLAITRHEGLYTVRTNRGDLNAKVVVCSAGPYSLLFAHRLKHPEAAKYCILPVAGNFYAAGYFLNGKVYPVQDPELPFSRVHADPAVDNPNETRFGPTIELLPLLERRHWWTFFDFLRVKLITWRGVWRLVKILSRKKMLKFAARNIVYKMPYVGKFVFLGAARNIIPTLRYRDLRFARGQGGIRPQLMNLESGKLEMGTAKFVGENIIFNVTPSPGASNCVGNGVEDARLLVQFLGHGYSFDEARFMRELGSFEPAR